MEPIALKKQPKGMEKVQKKKTRLPKNYKTLLCLN